MTLLFTMSEYRWRLVIYGFITFVLSSVDSVTEADIKECGSYIFGRVLCNSVGNYYRECIVPGATSIDLIKVHETFSTVGCSFTDTFGFRGNAVWVNKGCSGEFYVCYDGVRVSTDYPVLTVTPPSGKTLSPPDVASGSTSGGTDDVVLYIIIVVAIVLIVGLGLLIGCYVKQRQHRDRARRLAEKRQAKIDERNHKSRIEEHASTLPMATRSLSVESLTAQSSTSRNGSVSARDGACVKFEQEGSVIESVCSALSSVSEFSSVSAHTTGHIDISRPPLGTRKSSSSLSDIIPCSIYSEVGTLSKQNRCDLNSHSSLESIREVCNKYQMVDIPIERRYTKKSEHKNKYSTIGHGGTQNVATLKSGTMTLPIKRTKTRALVHVNPPHVPKDDTQDKSDSCHVTTFEQHYHDPDMLNISQPTERMEERNISLYDRRLPTEEDEEYADVETLIGKKIPAEAQQPTDCVPIYATVAKSCLKSQPQNPDNLTDNGSLNVTIKEKAARKRETNNNVYSVSNDREYSYLHSFRPQDSTTGNASSKELSTEIKATDC